MRNHANDGANLLHHHKEPSLTGGHSMTTRIHRTLFFVEQRNVSPRPLAPKNASSTVTADRFVVNRCPSPVQEKLPHA